MTVVSGRGAHVPLLLEAVMVTRLSVTVTALLKKVLMKVLMLDVLMRKVKVFVVMMMGVFLSLSSSSPPTLTTRPCGACLTQNISKAGDPDLGRGERTNWRRNLPAARFLFLLARHLEGASVIIFCYSDRGCLFPLTRYRPPRDARERVQGSAIDLLSRMLVGLSRDDHLAPPPARACVCDRGLSL